MPGPEADDTSLDRADALAPPEASLQAPIPWQALHVNGTRLQAEPGQGTLPLESARWEYEVRNPGRIDNGRAVFWVDVHQDLVLREAPGVDGAFCAWRMGMTLYQPDVTNFIGVRCVTADSPELPAGLYQVVFILDLLDFSPKDVAPGDRWEFTLGTAGRTLDGSLPAEVHAAAASPSRIELEGLRDFPAQAPACLQTYQLAREVRLQMGTTTYNLAGVRSGSGFQLRLDEGQREGAAVQVAWQGEQQFRIDLQLAETNMSVEGASPLSFALNETVLEGLDSIRGSAWMAEAGFAGRATTLGIVTTQTFTCPS